MPRCEAHGLEPVPGAVERYETPERVRPTLGFNPTAGERWDEDWEGDW